MKATNNAIKQLRIKNKMSLEELGSKIGTSKQTIQRYESGEIKNIPRDKIIKLASALGCDPAYLMGWQESENKNVLPQFEPEHIELIKMYSKLSAEQKQSILTIMKSMM